jgi:hypothetical protein
MASATRNSHTGYRVVEFHHSTSQSFPRLTELVGRRCRVAILLLQNRDCLNCTIPSQSVCALLIFRINRRFMTDSLSGAAFSCVCHAPHTRCRCFQCLLYILLSSSRYWRRAGGRAEFECRPGRQHGLAPGVDNSTCVSRRIAALRSCFRCFFRSPNAPTPRANAGGQVPVGRAGGRGTFCRTGR